MATTVITVPIMSTPDAANRFQQNWLSRNPTPPLLSDCCHTESNLDDSLTSLNWLQNLRIMRIQQPTPPSSPTPLSSACQRLNTTITIQNHKGSCGGLTRLKTTQEEAKAMSRISTHQTMAATSIDQIDYKTNQDIKPPYSYATLIWMALKASKKNKITLSAIYKWIKDNFKYYQTADPSWQNSIRHNLSLNKCFIKVPRKKDEPGKGGFWQIDPAHADFLESGIFKKRRSSSIRDCYMENIKRIKIEPVDDDYECIENHHNRKQSTPKKKVTDWEMQKFRLNSKGDLSDSDENLPSAVLKNDFSWNSIFQSEIDVEGIKIKAEDILEDTGEERLSSPSLQISPPPSNEGHSNPEDFLDLSINGVHIPRPAWFEEHLQELEFAPEEAEMLLDELELPPSPVSSINDQQSHPWAEVGKSVTFDVDDMLDLQSLPVGDDLPWDLSFQSLSP